MTTRYDTADELPGSTLFGVDGFGVLGSELADAGRDGQGFIIAYASTISGYATKEIAGRITRFPTNGELIPQEDGSFIYTGDTDSFEWQLVVDGVDTGPLQFVSLIVGDGGGTEALTGVQATGGVGSLGFIGSTVLGLTGVFATASVGNLASVNGQTVGLTGVGATGSVGTFATITGGNALVPLVGVSATASVGAFSTIGGDSGLSLSGVGAFCFVGNMVPSGGNVHRKTYITVSLDGDKRRDMFFREGEEIYLSVLVYAHDGDPAPLMEISDARMVINRSYTVPVGSFFTVQGSWHRVPYRLTAEIVGVKMTLAHGSIIVGHLPRLGGWVGSTSGGPVSDGGAPDSYT